MKYAEMLGICFQIKDDIFDYFDNPDVGKPTGNDLREGKNDPAADLRFVAHRHAPNTTKW